MRFASMKFQKTGNAADFRTTRAPGRTLGARLFLCLTIGFASLFCSLAESDAETRTLRMYYTHSKESATITFKKNGRYIKSGLRKANRFLRDWRRKEPFRMDPELLDLVWEVYQKSGSRSLIYVISGYRSPKTNNMLRRRGRKVARRSQHTKGKALDFFLKDVSVEKLRALGLKAHRGGVGYYRGSFVHLDTGRVRHWPAMSRRQLSRVFPRGKTIHLPSNGRRLRGYKTAMLNLKRGLNANGSKRTTTVRRTLLARIFSGRGGNDDEGEEEGRTVVALKSKPKKPIAKKASVVATARSSPKKPSGPDPFSAESKAANKLAAREKAAAAKKALADSRKLEADKKLEEIEDAKAIEIARAKEAEDAAKRAELASLVPERPALPRSRPDALPVLALAPAAEPASVKVDHPPRDTEIALATPPAIQNILRPFADVPNVQANTVPVSIDNLASLKQRIETALAQPRQLSAVEKATELQSWAILTGATKPTPKPQSLAIRPAASQVALAFQDHAVPLPTAVPGASADTPATADEVIVALADNVSKPAWRSATVARATATETEPNPNLFQVPVPMVKPDKEEVKPKITALPANAPENNINHLELGNLDGSKVKQWAVSLTTRMGPAADLRAPVYKQGISRAVPQSVYSIGFNDKSAPLRSDRFSGRALTRVAFAHFGTTR